MFAATSQLDEIPTKKRRRETETRLEKVEGGERDLFFWPVTTRGETR
jgi:hypothetical protein